MNLIDAHICPVCLGKKHFEIYREENTPTILRPLPLEDINLLKRKKIPQNIPLIYAMCETCSHIFMLKRPTSSFFDDLYTHFYSTYVSQLKQGLGVLDSDLFFEKFIGKLKQLKINFSEYNVLEVGCFEGYVMSLLKKEGISAYGCDPSIATQTGIKLGLNIERSVFTENVFRGMSFDCIYSRHVLEHIENPIKFLENFSARIADNGLVFIEVPNGDYALHQASRDPFHIEHISTFTSSSLAYAFKKAGYTINETFTDSRNLILAATKSKDANAIDEKFNEVFQVQQTLALGKQFAANMNNYNSQVNLFIKNNFTSATKIALWGAGSSGINFLSTFRHILDSEVIIIDSAENKKGLSFYNFPELIVESPFHLITDPVDYIIVTSQFYDEIVNDIKNIHKLDTKILVLRPEIKLI